MGIYNTATNTWEHDTAYTYDSMSRLATLASLGKSATYTRINSSNRLSNVALTASTGTISMAYNYDNQLRLFQKNGYTRLLNAQDEVSGQGYALTPNSQSWNYVYDSQGQVTYGRHGYNSSLTDEHIENFSYDQIGNYLSDSLTYNTVNQPSSLVYDADGNLLQNGSTLYTYDAENRLRTIGTATNYNELFYDYAGRCFKRQTVLTSSSGVRTTVNEFLVYDKTKIIAVVNRLGTSITSKYTWQPPTSDDADVLLWDSSYIYTADFNKNLIARYQPNSSESSGFSKTDYTYTPFGEALNGLPGRFGFSSEESYRGLYLYLYRAYSPALKRWLTRDPIEENGGVNLYGFVGNNPMSKWDVLGGLTTEQIVTWGGIEFNFVNGVNISIIGSETQCCFELTFNVGGSWDISKKLKIFHIPTKFIDFLPPASVQFFGSTTCSFAKDGLFQRSENCKGCCNISLNGSLTIGNGVHGGNSNSGIDAGIWGTVTGDWNFCDGYIAIKASLSIAFSYNIGPYAVNWGKELSFQERWYDSIFKLV